MKKTTGGWLCILLTAALLFVYYHFQILNANNITYTPYGDGYKNYYTFAYYLKFDSGTHFSGMNYPYGEHVMFTDNQPAFVWLFKPIAVLFPAFTNYAHAILAWLIFFSVIAAAYFIFLTLVLFDLSIVLAVVFSVCIALLSPQLHRMYTHYSLSYTCFVPGVIYLASALLKRKGSVKYAAWLCLFVTFFAFVHVYYAAMAGMFLLLLTLCYALVQPQKNGEKKAVVLQLVIAAILPIVVLKLFLLVTDSVTDRPDNPWGFVASAATWCDIFLHQYSFIWDIFRKIFPDTPTEFRFEGTGYIGFLPLISCLVALFVLPAWLIAKSKWHWMSHPLFVMLPAAVGVLLFSMAFPFATFPATEKYYQLLPSVVKQFRAAGRFNWIFYYTVSIFAALLFYKVYKYISRKSLFTARIFLMLVLSVWFCDAHMISMRLPDVLKKEGIICNEEKDAIQLKTKLAERGYQSDSFQAIFPIGFFLNGSEKIYVETGNTYGSMKTSLFTGLPIVSGQMSRTSESVAFNIARLMADDILTKPVLDLYKNKKPLLLVCSYDEYTRREKSILQYAAHLFDINEQSFYLLPLSYFKSTADSIRNQVEQNLSKYVEHENYKSSANRSSTVFKDFDGEPKPFAVFGNGAVQIEKGDLNLYFDTLPNASIGNYEISAWVYSDNRRSAFPTLYASQVDTNGVDIERYEFNAKLGLNTYGKWVRCSIPFKLLHPKNKIYAASGGEYVSYDELMIRPVEEEIVSHWENDSIFMFNNFPVTKK